MKSHYVAMVLAIGCMPSLVAGDPVFKAGKETTLPWKGLPKPIKVYLPTDYSPTKKHPCIFFYHGTNGDVDTRFMRALTGGRTYVIVGMEYHIRGKVNLPPKETEAYHANNFKTYKAIRKHLESRISIDPKQVYMSGVSKGGWITSLQGEQDMKNLAGLIILKAGRYWTQPPIKDKAAFKGKPIYIGVGELDPNDLSSHWARHCYSKHGAKIALEEYLGIGHEISLKSGLLSDWLEVQGPLRTMTDDQKAVVDAWGKRHLARIKAIEDKRKRYYELDLLRINPKVKFLSNETLASLKALWKEATKKDSAGHDEQQAEKAFYAQLVKEYAWWTSNNGGTLSVKQLKTRYSSLKAIHGAYTKIVTDYPKTRYAKRAKTASKQMEAGIANIETTLEKYEEFKGQPKPPGTRLKSRGHTFERR